MNSRILLILFFLSFSIMQAKDFAPRVVSSGRADSYSMKTFAQYHQWKDLKDYEQIIAIYNYLTDKVTGIFPMGAGAIEGEDVMYEYKFIRDPVKMINVYPVGYCDMLGPTLEGVLIDGGIGEDARTVSLPGIQHVFTEVKIKDKWCYLDLDVRGIFIKSDGSLASTEEGKTNPDLWKKPYGPKFFPFGNMYKGYHSSPIEYRHRVNMGGHTMDFVLRRGESFTRWWKPQQDRWNHNDSYHTGGKKSILERAPLGPKCKHPSFSIHHNGNGQFIYKPDLTNKSEDFADGVYDSKNIKQGPDGITLSAEGEGYVIFETRSPYVIVPRVGQYENLEDDKEASVVKLKGKGFSLELSKDNGLTWVPITLNGDTVDLTQFIARTYGYLLKINLKGKPQEALVSSFEVETWVQLHPASLPALVEGTNKMKYVTGDHYNLKTRVVEIRTNGSKPEEFLKYLSQKPKNFNSERKTSRAKGEFVAKVSAPPGTKIAWFSGGGNFMTHRGEHATKTKNIMSYAVEEAGPYTEFYKANVPNYQAHWHYNADVEVKLEKPADVVYIKYYGDPGVNNLRIYAHCVENNFLPATPVEITHGWKENNELKTKTFSPNDAGEYEVQVGAQPENEFIKMAIPSSLK